MKGSGRLADDPLAELDLAAGIAGGFDRRALPLRLGVLVVLFLAAAFDYGHEARAGHWIVLLAYGLATAVILWGLHFEAARDRPWLPFAATTFDAAVAVYVIADHAFSASPARHATDAVSALPAYLFLLQTGLRFRPTLVASFAGLVAAGWVGTLVALRFTGAGESDDILSREIPRLLTFAAAAIFVLYASIWTSRAAKSTLQAWRERLLLARFLPAGIETVASDPTGAVSERRATVLAVDLRGSSELARMQPPARFVAWLLEIRALVHDAVTASGGIVDKYVGDGVLALFLEGDAERQARNALAAVEAIVGSVADLNVRREGRGLPPLRTITSVHAGRVLAGVFDDGRRAEFTVLGPCMNDLSRIERRAKEANSDVVVSADILQALAPDGWRRWTMRRLAPPSQSRALPELFSLQLASTEIVTAAGNPARPVGLGATAEATR